MSQNASADGGRTAGDINSELESFRKQWRAEVQARTAAPGSSSSSSHNNNRGTDGGSSHFAAAGSSARRRPPLRSGAAVGAPSTAAHPPSEGKKPAVQDADDDYVQSRSFDEPVVPTPESAWSAEAKPSPPREPVTALEHYEKAVEREVQGSLGDSLRHYRAAFRLDNAVDKKYNSKHFPAPVPGGATGASVASGGKAAQTAAAAGPPPTLKELIASFAGLTMEAAPPPIEGMPPPPCPLAALPDEILVQILGDVAVADVGDFVRLARVCKKLAFLVATEDRIWRQVCEDAPFGFGPMHRSWQRTIEGEALATDGAVEPETTVAVGATSASSASASASTSIASAADLRAVYGSWQRMFRQRPRVRFNGCYISTVNYIRAGQASANLVTWNSPVHIVTYFRYLRFFRDGTVLSLLSTHEPADVVHHLTKDTVALHQDGPVAHLPSVVVKGTMRGRWQMSSVSQAAADSDDGQAGPAPALSPTAAIDAESDLEVETEGVGKYYYSMALTMRSAGKGTRNNKLQWRGFYSYNRLTDDWGEFELKNDRPFFFSRVKSYGLGE